MPNALASRNCNKSMASVAPPEACKAGPVADVVAGAAAGGTAGAAVGGAVDAAAGMAAVVCMVEHTAADTAADNLAGDIDQMEESHVDEEEPIEDGTAAGGTDRTAVASIVVGNLEVGILVG